MHRQPSEQDVPRAQQLAERTFAALERFLHIETASGIALLSATAAALIWGNSAFAHSYYAAWQLPLSFGLGDWVFTQSLHFWIDDGLMTVFFLVVGMEIRREIHDGALSDPRQASLPIMAALGGVAVPALIYLSLNAGAVGQHGWAVPTATDIAFAVGVLALLGRAFPVNVRVFLLALAIIDDILAVLIIALFYSSGLDYQGFLVAGVGILLVLGFQQIGIGSAYAYVLPGAVTWVGLLMSGVHPALAGVVLGMLTPAVPLPARERPLEMVMRAAENLRDHNVKVPDGASPLSVPLKQLRVAQRELLPPVERVQMALHPWVAYVIMPLFALANAGVSLGGTDLSSSGPQWIMAGIALALVAGKPLGVIGVSWLMVRLGWCRLPPGVSWVGICLIGLLAGIGFTMSIFIAMLAFNDGPLLGAAKLGILLGSLIAAILGLTLGVVSRRMGKAA